jgi:hypothetical protein
LPPYTNPSVADFQAYFFRDFPYGTDMTIAVLDQDITSAFISASMIIDQSLFANQGAYNVGFFQLSAHYLVMNLRASSQGINGQFNFLQASKGAGPINEAFSIPQRILDDPFWSMLTKTNYGLMFLQLTFQQLSGQMFTAFGTTQP